MIIYYVDGFHERERTRMLFKGFPMNTLNTFWDQQKRPLPWLLDMVRVRQRKRKR